MLDEGPVATLEYTQEVIAALHVIIGQLKQYLGIDRVRMLDVPCGNMQWMARFLQTRPDVDYTGVDIVDAFIERHRDTFSDRRPWKFLNLDVVSDPVDVSQYDLIVIRAMLHLLTHGDVRRILHKVSNVTANQRPAFLLATIFPYADVNRKVSVNSYGRREELNFEIEPFRLNTPLCLFRDGPPSMSVGG